MSEIKINLNQRAKVRLTDNGLRVHQEYLRRLAENGVPAKFLTEPKIDADGYCSRWTFADLMHIFGSAVDFGTEPFDMNIIVLSYDHEMPSRDTSVSGESGTVITEDEMEQLVQEAVESTRRRASTPPENEPTTVLTSTIGHIGWDEMPNLRMWAEGNKVIND